MTDSPVDTAADSPVDAEEVEHVAALARVDLEDADVEVFTEQFKDILAYFDTLEDVPAVETEPDLTNVLRPDAIRDSLSQEDATANAAESEDGKFKGPRVS